ncbi:MAG: 4Fe-4S binding protein [Lachnospiraceae bacterium]
MNSKTAPKSWKYKVKYIIWTLWIIIVLFSYIYGHGIQKIDFFYEAEHGISVTSLSAYIIYYGIVLIIVVPALVGGKRSFCHYFCWMAPFMVIGMKLRKLLHLPGLKIVVEQEKCISCKKCNKVCPMSIEVETLIKHSDAINDVECIQCGACINNCPKNALAYKVKLDSGGVFISH